MHYVVSACKGRKALALCVLFSVVALLAGGGVPVLGCIRGLQSPQVVFARGSV